jgi:AhpD family alkylhydroperoxidase
VTPRIEPGNRTDVGLFAWTFSHLAGRVAKTDPPHLFLTMARRRALFRGWLRFAGRLMPGGKLPRRDTELIILRVAHLRDCAYEFDHHVRLGRRAGVTAADVERVRGGSSAAGWSDRERVLLAAVDQLHDNRDLDDAMWSDLRGHLTEADVVEFVLLAGHYEMLATFLRTLRIEPDAHR